MKLKSKPVYCTVCGAKLKWYHKRIEFLFTDVIPTKDRQDAEIYTWKEYVCSICYKGRKEKD